MPIGSSYTLLVTGSRDIPAPAPGGPADDGVLTVWRRLDEVLYGWCGWSAQGASGFVLRHGCAPGVDTVAGLWAVARGVAVDEHRADWDACGPDCPPSPSHRRRRTAAALRAHPGSGDTPVSGRPDTYCPGAGGRRNQAMADAQPRARLCLAFPTPGSRGTWDMVRRATAAGIEVEVHRLGEEAEEGRQAEMEGLW
jgi:hypothetical protein